MARPKKKTIDIDSPQAVDVEKVLDGSPSLPYALRRELEEISKNSGMVFDLTAPVDELEKICNLANNPPDAWLNRWRK